MMKYLPNLIPEKYRVLKDYFKGSPYETSTPNPLSVVFGWLIGLSICVLGLACIIHPILFILFEVLGFVITPFGHKLVSNTFRFILTFKIKAVLCGILILFIIPTGVHYANIDEAEAQALKKQEEQEKIQKEKLLAEEAQKEKERTDSLEFYYNKAVTFIKEKKTESANASLTNALQFANKDYERKKIYDAEDTISKLKVTTYIKSGKYIDAIDELNNLISHNKDINSVYRRAICLSKTGKTQEAVNDCKYAMQLGSKDAEKLYNKINPVRTRITGYVTRCCDGTTSYSTGRGTCSHHGGVCNWSEPIFEEYRQYE